MPVLLVSHGHGASLYLSSVRGYAPLVEFWASQGFVVIQVTHLDSATLALDATGPEGATFWRSRALDISALIDRLDDIAAVTPGLAGRLDTARIAVAGHSLGAQTVTMLCGARMTDPRSGEVVDLTESRLAAAVAIAPPGAGADLADAARRRYPELAGIDLATQSRPALVLVGDQDFSPSFSARRDWRSDAFHLAPPPRTLVTLFGADHLLGGISGWDTRETSQDDPAMLADVQRVTWAYLQGALGLDASAWTQVAADLAARGAGRVEHK